MPRLSILCATIALLAGCNNARDVSSLGNDAYTEGGFGSKFYAEVPYTAGEGGKTRVYIFGTVAAYDSFAATKEVDDKKNKKVISGGKTLVVEMLVGSAAKDDPKFTDNLVATYRSRHPVAPEPVVESAPEPVAPVAPVAPAPVN